MHSKSKAMFLLMAFLLSSSITALASDTELRNVKSTATFSQENIQNHSYNLHDTAAVIRDGEYVGYLKINGIQKLGIWDWFNSNAMANDVKTSYAINMTVNLEKLLKDSISVCMKPSFTLLDAEGKIIGKNAELGWSGFSDSIALYGEDKETAFEMVLQPTVKEIPKGATLVISFEESGHSLEPLQFLAEELNNLETTISMKSAMEPTQITSLNGGVYTFSIDSVTLSDNKFLPSEYGNPRDKQLVYDIKMRIKYDKAPKSSEPYTRFSSDNKMSTSLFLGLQSDIDSSILYEGNDKLLNKKAIYAEDDRGIVYFDKYVFEEYANQIKELQVGEMIEITFNRVVLDYRKTAVDAVRIIMEFPEEVKESNAYNSFSGRYIIYEVPLQREEEVCVEE